MKIVDFNTEYADKTVIALGFFDCIHLGHAALIETAAIRAKELGADAAAFTFGNDINTYFDLQKQIYEFSERCNAMESLGVDVVIRAEFDEDFAAMSPKRFIEYLAERFNAREFVVGEDYTFGRNAEGNVDLLKNICQNIGVNVIEVPYVMSDGEKISTRKLKQYVLNGDVERLNKFLSEPYFAIGKVIHGRHVGKQIGFPTANMELSGGKLALKDGIYATKISINGKTYYSMTNIGGKPTFDDMLPSSETYIFDFDGDIYGQTVKLSFYKRTRDIHKFSSAEQLIARLKSDEKMIRTLFESTNFVG